MDCLVHFNGWTDHSPVAEKRLRMLVSRLKLRPLAEPGDVDSPLLRSQVDEHFLRAMASAREQITNGGIQQERANLHKSIAQQVGNDKTARKIAPNGRNTIPLHPQRVTPLPASYPFHANQTPAESAYGKGGDAKPYGYQGHGGHWWANGWPQYAYCDENSVQSGLSNDSYLQQYNEYGMYPGTTPGMYYGPPQDRPDFYYGQLYPPPPGMTPEQYQADGWMGHPPTGDPNSTYAQTTDGSSYIHPPGTPTSHSSPHQIYNPYQYSPSHMQPGRNFVPDNRATPVQTPHKSPYAQAGVPSSPYWGHLDQSTLAMTGLVTPHGKVPETPQRSGRTSDGEEVDGNDSPESEQSHEDFAANAKPLLINNWSSQYYGPQYGAREGWAPPSPATQFMMSPQASSQAAAYYAHNYNGGAYGFSPHRHSLRQHRDTRRPPTSGSPSDKNGTPPTSNKESNTDVTPPPTVRKVTENGSGRDSPVTACTVETLAETESVDVES